MNQVSKESLRKILNQTEFKGLENICCGDAYYYYIEGARCSCLRAIKRILRIAFLKRYTYVKKGNGNILFLFSKSYEERKDFLPWFHKVIEQSGDYFVSEAYTGKRVSLRNIKYLPLVLSWRKKLQAQGISLTDRMNCYCWLYEAKTDLEGILYAAHKNSAQIKLAVVLSDVHPIDSIIVQYYNKIKIPTATLQHGLMTARRSGWALLASLSKYFLAYGQFSYEECIKAGMKKEKVIQLGVPKFIEKQFNQDADRKQNEIGKSDNSIARMKNKNSFGVILDGKACHDSNVQLLKECRDYAIKHKQSYMVKLHPGEQMMDYQDLLSCEYLTKVYTNEITTEEFGRMIRFAVMCGSTVFVEYLQSMIPCVLYVADPAYDVYESIEWCKCHNKNQFEKLLLKMDEDVQWLQEQMIECSHYFSKGEDIAKNYREFFLSFMQ